MNLKSGLTYLGLFVLGFGAAHLYEGNSYNQGRLSACKDVAAAVNANLPITLDCAIERGEVTVFSSLGGPRVPLKDLRTYGQPIE